MKLPAQALAAIMPLFVGLALVSGALIFLNKQDEMVWGAQSRTKAAAVAMAEFIRAEWLRAADPAMFATRLTERIGAVAVPNRIERVSLVLADGTSVVEYGVSKGYIDALAKSPEVQASIAAGSPYVSRVIPSPEDGFMTVAFVPILDGDGKLAAVLRLRTDMDEYGTELERMRDLIIALSVVIVAAGLAVSLWVTWRIARPLRKLKAGVWLVASGEVDRWQPVGGLREIEELDESLRTVQAVMRKELEKSRQGMLENEQLRDMDDLLDTLARRYAAPLSGTIGGVVVDARCLRPDGTGFLDLWEADGGGCLVLGRMDWADPLDRVAGGRAAAKLLRGLLAGEEDMAAALARVGHAFPDARLLVALWERDASRVAVWEVLGGEARERPPLFLEPGRTVVLEMLSADASETLGRYLDQFGHLPPAILGSDLAALLPNRRQGILALLATEAAAEPAARRAATA